MNDEISQSQIDRIERLQYRQLATTMFAIATIAATQTSYFSASEWGDLAGLLGLFSAVIFLLYVVMLLKDSEQLGLPRFIGGGEAE